MKFFIVGIALVFLMASCSSTEEGFLGEWEGEIFILNNEGVLVESEISCVITSSINLERNVALEVSGKTYTFKANEEMDILTYKDQPLSADSIVMEFISGHVELVHDTMLHFEHQIYALKNNALLYSDDFEFEMVRK
ncbi:MAG: hypothetical protein P1U56_24310 [Saprospiraceae bacterium]|nr:hypothetical protein [Saprospiraceae bacterium]